MWDKCFFKTASPSLRWQSTGAQRAGKSLGSSTLHWPGPRPGKTSNMWWWGQHANKGHLIWGHHTPYLIFPRFLNHHHLSLKCKQSGQTEDNQVVETNLFVFCSEARGLSTDLTPKIGIKMLILFKCVWCQTCMIHWPLASDQTEQLCVLKTCPSAPWFHPEGKSEAWVCKIQISSLCLLNSFPTCHWEHICRTPAHCDTTWHYTGCHPPCQTWEIFRQKLTKDMFSIWCQ